eukprot:TRINITY_DN10203_c0_g1_i1.p1 TRINITY_DN10203_c0_g1~~TRINITY_DN10203_c0_g1_i1.p1  ORF type:complete len:230 (-),score=17.70 TRINITY_DN10203_c0_g1_i1:54-743(-)
MNDASILAKLGFSKLHLYYWKTKNSIVQLPITQPNGPLVWFGLHRPTSMMDTSASDIYSDNEREKILAKSALLLKEAKETGNYRELMQMDVLDPRHPFYYEHPWQSALKVDPYTLTPYQRYKRWHALAFRAVHDWDQLGLLHDDLLQPTPQENNIYAEEAVLRLPFAQRQERERRLSRAYDMVFRQELLADEDCTHPEDDVAYLMPYFNMSVCENRESRDNPVDYLYSR